MNIIFLYGTDTYRLQQKLKEIVVSYEEKNKSGLNLRHLDCSALDILDIKKELTTISMFKEKKLLILENVFLNEQLRNDIVENKELLKTDNIIVFVQEGNVKKVIKLFKLLNKIAIVQDFFPLTGVIVRRWIQREFQKYNAVVSPEVIEKLALEAGDDLWRLSNEIKKLSTYSKKIGVKEIELLISINPEAEIFATIEAVASKNKERALALLQRHLNSGESPIYLLSMIIYQFRSILEVKDRVERNAGFSGIHPFVVKKTLALANRFTFLELKQIYHKLFEIDVAIKTGKADAKTALTLLVSSL